MKRREFVALAGATVVAWPRAARAQQTERLARIGYLIFTSPAVHARYSDAFRAGLRRLGYVEGKNVHIEYRFAEGDNDRLPGLAAELVSQNVDVILTYATGVDAAQRASATLPIVMATYSDAVATGLVANLARPGGNVTGSTFFAPELAAKRLELLKEVVPSMTRAGVFLLRDNPSRGHMLEVMGATAAALKVELQPLEVSRLTDFESAFSTLADKKIDAFVVTDHAFFISHVGAIASFAAKHRFTSIGPLELAATGGLMAYGVNFSELFRRAAVFVDKILRGAKPGDIPVEQAVKFLTIVNLKAAKALGLEVPTSVLLRADEVIE